MGYGWEVGFTAARRTALPVGLPGRERLIRPGDASSCPEPLARPTWSCVGSARVNGWIDHGRLVPLRPANGDAVGYETW